MTVEEVVRQEAAALGSCRLVSASTVGADSDEEIHFIVYETGPTVQNGFAYFQRRYSVWVNGVRSATMILAARSERADTSVAVDNDIEGDRSWRQTARS